MPEAAATDREAHIARFLAANGWGKAARGRLAGDASFRHYDRLEMAGKRAVLMDAPPPQEDVRPYAAVAELLRNMGYSAPRIFAVDAEHGLLLLEDFGDDTYTHLFAHGHDETKLYGLAVDLLIDLHRKFAPARHSGLPPSTTPAPCGGLAPARLVLARDPGRTNHAGAARDLPRGLARRAAEAPRRARHARAFDYHVDNLMVLPDRHGIAACGLLDSRTPWSPRAPSIWSRSCRTCAATCRRNWSPPCASATSRPSPLSTVRPSI
jgi:aminoglycoside/choline kinase family phosphotransferase